MSDFQPAEINPKKNRKTKLMDGDFVPAQPQLEQMESVPVQPTGMGYTTNKNIPVSEDPGSDSDNDIDIQLLRELQRRKEQRDRNRRIQGDRNFMSQFPGDFTNDVLAKKLSMNESESNIELMNKLRYNIHNAVHKLVKKNKLMPLNEISINYTDYPDAKITSENLVQLKYELEKRGFKCEFSDERAHRVKFQKPGVIMYLTVIRS